MIIPSGSDSLQGLRQQGDRSEQEEKALSDKLREHTIHFPGRHRFQPQMCHETPLGL